MRIRSLSLGALALLAACGGGGDSGPSTPSSPTPAAVATVDISPASATLLPPATQQLTVTLKDASGNTLSGRSITWSSDNSGIASVSTSGFVTSVAAGKATISAASEGKSGTASITVLAPVAAVTLDRATAIVAIGDSLQLTATLKDAAGAIITGRIVTWTSSAPTLATVSASGMITALAAGSVTITAASEGKSADAAVTVLPPVASITLNKSAGRILPGDTLQLTATLKDGNGATLSNRKVTWSSSAATIASVSASGLVSGIATGASTITATSEGKTATANITVDDGGVVAASGGSVNAAGGTVKVDIPSGAISTATAVTVAPATTIPALPAYTNSVAGTAFNIGPAGATFSKPVRVTVAYDPTKLPAWMIPSDLALLHYNGTKWEKLPDLIVDSVKKTVSATTTSFSPFTIGMILPPATLSPAPASVNFYQRSAQLTVTIPGHSNTGLQYQWTSTNTNGTISPLFANTAQYTMTQPQLPSGDLDVVSVVVSANINPFSPTVFVPVAFASTVVNSQLTYSFEVGPQFNEPKFGQAMNVDAVVRNADGSIYSGTSQLPVFMIWNSSQNHGTFNLTNPTHKTTTTRGTYTAKAAANSAALPPRLDQIDVDFYVSYQKIYDHYDPALGGNVTDSIVVRSDIKSGHASAFMDVEPKTYFAKYIVRRIPTTGGACITADAIVPRVASATSYDLTVNNIDPKGSTLAPTIHKTFSGVTNGGSILDIYLDITGTYYGVPLEGGCATTTGGINGRINNYNTAYGPATFVVKTTP